MTKGLLFWILFVLAVLFGGFGMYHGRMDWNWGAPFGVEMILIGLLGWHCFGGAVK